MDFNGKVKNICVSDACVLVHNYMCGLFILSQKLLHFQVLKKENTLLEYIIHILQ